VSNLASEIKPKRARISARIANTKHSQREDLSFDPSRVRVRGLLERWSRAASRFLFSNFDQNFFFYFWNFSRVSFSSSSAEKRYRN
jgi:hypothetical protein